LPLGARAALGHDPGMVPGEKAVWNAGLGTDAVRTLVRWGFRELNLNRVQDGRYLDTLVTGLRRDEHERA
jgi:hypothetical protein